MRCIEDLNTLVSGLISAEIGRPRDLIVAAETQTLTRSVAKGLRDDSGLTRHDQAMLVWGANKIKNQGDAPIYPIAIASPMLSI